MKTLYYKKIMSYALDGCVPGCREAEGRGRRQDGRDLSMERKKQLGSP